MLVCRDLLKFWLQSCCLNFQTVKLTSVIMSSVNLKSVKENILFLESRFSDCSTFKGTCKNHEFIPAEENIVMNYLSGDASKNLLIQQKETVLSIDHIIPGSFYACSYDEWYFGVGNCFSKNCDLVNIKVLHQNGPAAQFFRPSFQDTCWIPIDDIIAKVDAPSSRSTDRFYYFDCDEMKHVQNLMWFIWHPFPAESFATESFFFEVQ